MIDLQRYEASKTILLILALATSAVGGCGPIPIRYDFSTMARAKGSLSPGKTLNVNILEDARYQESKNKLVLQPRAQTRYGDEKVCVNSESKYAPGTVAKQISQMVASHVQHRAFFRSVTIGHNPNADFQLTGRVRFFYGRQGYSVQSAVGRGVGGLIGAAIAAGASTQGEIHILFTDLTVFDRNGAVVAKLRDVVGLYNEDLPADSNCFQIYHNVNAKLAYVVQTLSQILEESLTPGLAPPLPAAPPRPMQTQSSMPPLAVSRTTKDPGEWEISCEGGCPAGDICHNERCVNPCNPPCGATEVCTRSGKCLPRQWR